MSNIGWSKASFFASMVALIIGIFQLIFPVIPFVRVNIFLMTSATLLVIWLFLHYRYRDHIRKNIVIFIPRSSDSDDDFWAQFYLRLSKYVTDRGYHIEVKFNTSEYGEDTQIKLLREFPWSNVHGAIISPAGTSVIECVVKEIMPRHKKVKFVIHDTAPESAVHYFAKEPLQIRVVSVNNEKGGEIAAEILWDRHLRSHSNNSIVDVLIVPGNSSHEHSNLRVRGFMKKLFELAGHSIAVYMTADGDWTYLNGANSFKAFLENNAFKQDGNRKIRGIFVCNDEMAAGIDDVLSNIQGSTEFKEARIVGFDKSPAMVAVRRRGNTHIVGTVDAQIDKQACQVADLVILMMARKIVEDPIQLIEPTPA